MTAESTFYIVFLSQVLLLSFFLPRGVLRRLQHVLDTYPPPTYPRLYPVPLAEVEKAQLSYRYMNTLALSVGLVAVLLGVLPQTNDLLNWRNEALLAAYSALQLSPLLIAASPGFIYFNLKRKPDARSTRRAELRPRRLFDFISPTLTAVAVSVYAAFCALVVYVNTFDFEWFGGYVNIVVLTAGNLGLAAIIYKTIHGKRTDPYQATEDRLRQIERTVKLLIATSIVGTVFIALAIGLQALEWPSLTPTALSAYLQLLAVISFRSFQIDDVNFEVYRREAVGA